MSTKYQYMLVEPDSGRDIGVFSLDEPLTDVSNQVMIGVGPTARRYEFRNLDDDAPSEESVRFHEDQIERFEQNIERMQDQIVESRDQIDLHQQWLDDHVSQSWKIELNIEELQVVRMALARDMKASQTDPYQGPITETYRKINNQAAIQEANRPNRFPEMMKYPGRIKVGDYSLLT